MTLFLQVQLHRARLRDLVLAQVGRSHGLPPHPLVAICPTCGASFFADPEPPTARQRALHTWEALAKLDGECPDYGHWFTVGR